MSDYDSNPEHGDSETHKFGQFPLPLLWAPNDLLIIISLFRYFSLLNLKKVVRGEIETSWGEHETNLASAVLPSLHRGHPEDIEDRFLRGVSQ